jgi:hypothetical protein
MLLVVTCDRQDKRIVARQNAALGHPGWGLGIMPTTFPQKTMYVKKPNGRCRIDNFGK